jgi:arylsulfatase A-like enzyme
VIKKFTVASMLTTILISTGFSGNILQQKEEASYGNKPNVILFVWDGLRPDSVTKQTTPNLYALAEKGVWFNDNHSSYPTFTMMNAATFATGNFAGKTGFFGNTLWNPKAKGLNAINELINFQQPVYTEDYRVLQDLNHEEPLLEVFTLFERAQKAGILTATVGKAGASFIQDYKSQSVIFDEEHVYPESFAIKLKNEGYPLPEDTLYSYSHFKLNKNNGNPTGYGKVIMLKDGVTSDPATALISPYNEDTNYLMKSYLSKVIPYTHPQLSVIWLRNPDTTEHKYGVGSKAYYNALQNQDELLGNLINTLKKNNTWNKTNLIVVSDHGHSNVSGSTKQFPLRNINKNGEDISDIDNINGFSVSGYYRPADLLNRAGFKAFDGNGCQYNPILSGILADKTQVYPTKIDTTGSICGQLGEKYTTPAYMVPEKIPEGGIILAPNGGSTYVYIPNHNVKLVKRLVRFFQSREEFGSVFIDSRYGNLPGTLPLSLIQLENKNHRNPDIIVSGNFNETARIKGYPGTEFNNGGNNRGMHGTFSSIDVHNTLIAYGPNFKKNHVNYLPTGNVDVAPTIAHLLGIKLPDTDGRILYETLINNLDRNQSITYQIYQPKKPASDLIFQKATNPNGKDIIPNKNKYNIQLQTKSLQQDGKTYIYFDQAKAIRY